MVVTSVGYFLVDAGTIVTDVLLFLVVIFAFGGFADFFLEKVFGADRFQKEMPFLIRMNVKIVLGLLLMLVLTSLASLFGVLNQLYVLLVIMIILVAYFLVIIKNKDFHRLGWDRNQAELLPVIIVLVLGSVVRLLTLGLNGVIFPGDDVKFHSMLVELIRVNGGFFQTLEPFTHEIAAYPPGFHMIVAFFSAMCNQLSTKVLTVFVCFVFSLVGLGFYSLTYALSRSRVASFVSAVFVLFLNGEISLISLWGGVTLLLALYFTSAFLALIYFDAVDFGTFFHCIAGIAFTEALVTNTGLALMGLVFLIPFIFKKIVSKPVNMHTMKAHLISAISPFLTSSLLCCFLLLPLIFPSIMSVLGLVPADLIVPKIQTDAYTYGADWFSVGNFLPRVSINDGILLTIVLLLSVPLFVYLLFVYFRKKNIVVKTALFSYLTIFSWIFILIIFGVNNPKGVFFFEFPLWGLFVPSRIFTFLLLPLCTLAGLLFQFVSDSMKRIRKTEYSKTYIRRLKYAAITAFLVLSISIACIDVRTNQSTDLTGKSRIPISTSDLECFEWIKQNTTTADRFLVETSDAGQFISSFCDRAVVFPFTMMQYNSEYENLKGLMYVNPDSNETLNLLHEFKVDYVFIGSKATRTPFKTFNADLLLASSHYYLAFKSSESFIFRVMVLSQT
jgi:hypothetical protein